MQEESLIGLKRQEWRVEIRKKELESYFEKRRFELISEDYHRNAANTTDEQRCSHIATQIAHFSFAELRNALTQVVYMDPSLSVFYHLTHFDPRSPPAYFRSLIAETLGSHEAIDPEFWLDREFSGEERGRLGEIWREVEEAWGRAGPEYIGVLSEMKRVEDVDLLIREDFISFLSIVLSALLVFKRTAGVLGISLERQLVVGSDTLFRYEINTTLTLMHNILAGSDELLAPFLDGFLEINGCSFESEALYYNLFLIRSVTPHTKIKLFRFYANILENERGEILDNYEAVVSTLYAALKVCPEFAGRQEREDFEAVCERIVRFLADLLTVINMRYETFCCGQSEDYKKFLYQLTWMLHRLGSSGELIGRVMEAKSIHTFLLNHLNASSADEELRLISLCLRLLCAAAENPYSTHFFLNEEPRFMIKVLLLFDRLLEVDFQAASAEAGNALNSLLLLLCSLSTIGKVVEQLLQKGLLHKIGLFYFRINQSKCARQIRDSCEILYVNLLTYLKERASSLAVFFEHLFDKNGSYRMLVEMLKLTPQRREIVRKALMFLSFTAYNCQQTSQFLVIRSVLLSETLASRLFQLHDCELEDICEKAEYIMKIIESLKRVRTASRAQEEEYGQEEYGQEEEHEYEEEELV